MNYKDETKKAYDTYTDDYESKFQTHLDKSGMVTMLDDFIKRVGKGKVLDAGSGPGHHAKYFKSHGLEVHCIDFSEKMIEKVRQKGLEGEVMDIENITLPSQSFDGIWAYTSLLHIPKDKVHLVITGFKRVLKPGGHVGIALKEGHGEGLEASRVHDSSNRYFAYYTSEEFIKAMGDDFEVLEQSMSEFSGFVFLRFLFKLKQK
jgi:ubiquinone/menaquinone biosynthesis C-methylase UbiE